MPSMPFIEAFSYDGLNWLTDVQLTVASLPSVDTLDIDYDLSGRITSKNLVFRWGHNSDHPGSHSGIGWIFASSF